jgi:NAD(P)H-dependent FMN reductase
MTTILRLAGSLRRPSFNTAFFRAAAGLMPADSTLDVRTLPGNPLFGVDDNQSQTYRGVTLCLSLM